MQLIQGDCLEEMKNIPDGSVDMVLTDPPYGTTQNKWDSVIDLELMWEQLKRVIKPNGAIVMTASQPFTSALVMSNLKMFKYEWVWEKNRSTKFLSIKHNPLIKHESVIVFLNNRLEDLAEYLKEKRTSLGYRKLEIDNLLDTNTLYTFFEGRNLRGEIVFSKPNKNHYEKLKTILKLDERFDEYIFNDTVFNHIELKNTPPVKKGVRKKHRNDNHYSFESNGYISRRTGYSKSIIGISCEKNIFHPTQKPVALMEYLIKTYTNEGDIVLDFTAGSFTTGVACVNIGRKFIGIEKDKNYFNIGTKRIKETIKCLDLKIEPTIITGDSAS